MGESYVPMPTVLVGTKNLAGVENVKIIHEPVAVVEVETPEVLMDVVEDVILESEIDNELVEVLGFFTQKKVTWARIQTENGNQFDVPENEWAFEYGDAGEMELMSAYDRASIMALRKTHNLIAA
jgi:hypothetical protein